MKKLLLLTTVSMGVLTNLVNANPTTPEVYASHVRSASPISASREFLAYTYEHPNDRSGKGPLAVEIHEKFAKAVADTTDPIKALELFIAHEGFAKDHKTNSMHVPHALEIHTKFAKAVADTTDPIKALELFTIYQNFAKDHKTNSMHVPYALEIHTKFAKAITDTTDPIKALELFAIYKDFAKDHKTNSMHVPYALEIHTKFAKAVTNTTDPIKALELFTIYEDFAKDHKTNSMHVPYALEIHTKFDDALKTEKNPVTIVAQYDAWKIFSTSHKPSGFMSPSPKSYESKYTEAQEQVTKMGALVALPSSSRSAVSGEVDRTDNQTISKLVTKYGTVMLDSNATQSRIAFQEAFTSVYRTAARVLHPDKNSEDGIKMADLNADKDWVDALTDATFRQASGK